MHRPCTSFNPIPWAHKIASTDLICMDWQQEERRKGYYLFISLLAYLFLLKEVHHLTVASHISVETENHHCTISVNFRKNYVAIQSCKFQAVDSYHPGRKSKESFVTQRSLEKERVRNICIGLKKTSVRKIYLAYSFFTVQIL